MTSKKASTSPRRAKKAARTEEEEGAEARKRLDKCLRMIADRHGLLIMRELSMKVTRFQDIQLQTKISSHALTSRLRRLEKDGIIERRRYSIRPPRYEYLPTAKGRGLDELLFAAANWDVLWGNAGVGHEPSLIVYDKETGIRLGPPPRKSTRATSRKRLAL